MVQAVAFSSVSPRWKSYTQSNSPSRYYVLEKKYRSPSSSAQAEAMGIFSAIKNIVGRRNASPQGVRGNASPPGDKRKRKPARRQEETQARQAFLRICNPQTKRLDLFNADLQSASSENAQRRYEKPTAADCKSATKRSSLFDGGLQIRRNAWRTRVPP